MGRAISRDFQIGLKTRKLSRAIMSDYCRILRRQFFQATGTAAITAGIPVPDYLEGASMVPLLQNPERFRKKAAFSQFPRGLKIEGYAIRTERHRYVEWWNKERDGARHCRTESRIAQTTPRRRLPYYGHPRGPERPERKR